MVSESEPHDGAANAPVSPSEATPAPQRRHRHWVRWLLLLLVLAVLGGWFSRKALVERVEQKVITRLASEGIYLRYGSRTWSPWRGLHLENVVLRRAAQNDQPVVEISAVTLGVPLRDVFRSRELISRWRLQDATVTLHDDVGPITFEHVTTRLVARPGELEISQLDGRHGSLALVLSGHLKIPPSEKTSSPAGPFLLDLSVVRSIIAVLDFKTGSKPFTIRGTGSIEVRAQADTLWQADLTGEGEGVEWQGIPFRQLTVHGLLSSTKMDLTSVLQFTSGAAKMNASRADWDAAPLVLSGTLTDGAGATDQFSGSYQRPTQTVTLQHLAGKADLLAFTRNFPRLAGVVPASVRVAKFPDLLLQNLSWTLASDNQPAATPAWQLGSLEVRSPGSIAWQIAGQAAQIELLEGQASFLENTWKAQGKTGPVAWRDLRVRGSRFDATLAGRKLKSTLAVQLPIGSADLAVASDDLDRAPLELTGTLEDAKGQSDRFAATYRPGPAAGWQVARLDGKANLFEFAGNFPGVPARLPAGITLRSAFPEIAVRDFSYRPGKAPAIGSLRLVSPADLTVTVKGRAVPIDRLSGQVSSEGQGWKLSRVNGRIFGGQASVDGTYENAGLRDATVTASGLQLAQLQSWMGESGASLGSAILNFDYRGAYSAENPASVTGSGHVHLENAPIVKIPLLDQTYGLFAVLSKPIDRRGNGSLDTTFSASKGIVTVTEFVARSDSARVTATGTIDLLKREVDGRARGNIRGIFGLATTPISRALEMKISGPLDQLRVRPLGFDGVLTGTLTGTAEILPNAAQKSTKLTSDIVRNGLALPFRAFGLLTPDRPEPSKKP